MNGFIRQLYKSILSYETRLWLYKMRHLSEFRRKRTIVYPSDKGDFSLCPFDEHRCIFVHITKSAGTSVATSLFGYLPYHHTAIDYRVIYGRKDFDRYFKFAFVRNPWDRLYSAYRYLMAGGWNDDDRQWAETHLSQFDNFHDFVTGWLDASNINKHRHFWPQYYFLCDRHKKILVDYLAYFETINQDFDTICRRLDIDAEIEHRNANPGKDYRLAYDDTTRELVGQVYATDIELFGYTFDGIEHRTDPGEH